MNVSPVVLNNESIEEQKSHSDRFQVMALISWWTWRRTWFFCPLPQQLTFYHPTEAQLPEERRSGLPEGGGGRSEQHHREHRPRATSRSRRNHPGAGKDQKHPQHGEQDLQRLQGGGGHMQTNKLCFLQLIFLFILHHLFQFSMHISSKLIL